jgi:nucleoside phosphorylase
MSDHTIQKVLIVIAMTHEALPLVSAFGLQPLKSEYQLSPPMVGYIGKSGSGEILLVINGPRFVNNLDGTKRIKDQNPVTVEGVSPVSAALATWEGVRVFKPDIIINTGTVGGIKAKGAVKGNIYLCKTPIRYHDRLINFRLPGDDFEPNNYQAFGIGSYLPVSCPKLAEQFSLPYGSLSTGSSFDESQGNILEQFEKNEAFLKEMEAGAVAEVAQLTGIPFLILKGVTDYIDKSHHETVHEQFEKELVPVSEKISQTTIRIVEWLMGRKTSDI